MKRLRWFETLILVLVVLAGATMVWAFASQRLVVSTTPVGFTASTYLDASRAQLAVESYAVRWTCDPALTLSTTLGIPAAAGSYIWLDSRDKIRNFKALRSESTDAVIQAEFFRGGE